MKNVAWGFLVVFFLSCGDNTTTTTDDTTTAPTTPVENVNGNIPDTTNSISPDAVNKTPDSTHLKDSLSGKDSARR